MTPEVKAPPEKERQPFRVEVVVLAHSKGDAAEQVRHAIQRLGGTFVGAGVSSRVDKP